MDKERDIKSYFDGVLENLDIILQNDFYKLENRATVNDIRNKINNWYNTYQNKNSLKNIEPKELEYLAHEITDLFDKFYNDEDIDKNYTERLLYDFGSLEKLWKKEMLGDKKWMIKK